MNNFDLPSYVEEDVRKIGNILRMHNAELEIYNCELGTGFDGSEARIGCVLHYPFIVYEGGIPRRSGRYSWNPTNVFEIKKVIFNDPATIVFWADGKKTVVKCSEGDTFDPEKGLAMAYMKRHMGNDNSYHKIFKKWIPDTCTTNKEFEKTNSKRYPWGELIEEDDSK